MSMTLALNIMVIIYIPAACIFTITSAHQGSHYLGHNSAKLKHCKVPPISKYEQPPTEINGSLKCLPEVVMTLFILVF